ncbi:hypothetical protein ABH313_13035, partial [Chromobacterium vaccinii]
AVVGRYILTPRIFDKLVNTAAGAGGGVDQLVENARGQDVAADDGRRTASSAFSGTWMAISRAPLEGKLRELAADADPATRTYPARIALAGDSHALQLGMTATATLPARASGELKLPLTALLDLQGKQYVWTIDGQSLRVSRKPVTVASIDDSGAVIASGVRPGDKVATAGVHLLREGQRVKLLEQ